MGLFGERMQREREMRGITIEEISESTKIGSRSLRALEAEDFDKLPGGIFNKGFVRAYARYLGIDEEQAVADFVSAYGDYQQQLPIPPEAALPTAEAESEPPSINILLVGVLVVLLGLGFGAWRLRQPIKAAANNLVSKVKRSRAAAFRPAQATIHPTPLPPVLAPSPASDVVLADAKSAANPPLVDAKEPSKPSPEMTKRGEFVLQFRARQDSWVSITADDRLLVEGTLKGEKTVRAKNKVVFRTGNAGGIEVSFNGQVQPVLGADNQVRTVVFTPDGMQR